ncbi:MAG: DNA polymerase III subunit beta [bacterium]
MKFTAKKSTLLDGLKTISGAVANKSTLPILTNIILEASDDHLELVATDLEVSIETKTPASIQEEGSCTIPAKKLRRLVNELPSSDTLLEFTLEGDSKAEINVEETTSSFEMPVLDREEYPSLPQVGEGTSFELPAETLEHILNHSTFAAGTDTSRSYLCGVYFDINDSQLNVVSTDAHRLAKHEAELEQSDLDLSLLVPTQASKELSKILRDAEEDTVHIHTDEQLVEFKTDSTRMVSRLIDEDFPDYNQVIPQDYEKRMTVDRDRFLDAVRRVSLMADEKTRRLLIEVDSSELTVRAETSEEGGGEEILDINYKGDPQKIAFNGDYLQAVLKHIEDDEIYFDLISEDSPGTFRPMEAEDNYLYIIMPLRLN